MRTTELVIFAGLLLCGVQLCNICVTLWMFLVPNSLVLFNIAECATEEQPTWQKTIIKSRHKNDGNTYIDFFY